MIVGVISKFLGVVLLFLYCVGNVILNLCINESQENTDYYYVVNACVDGQKKANNGRAWKSFETQ